MPFLWRSHMEVLHLTAYQVWHGSTCQMLKKPVFGNFLKMAITWSNLGIFSNFLGQDTREFNFKQSPCEKSKNCSSGLKTCF